MSNNFFADDRVDGADKVTGRALYAADHKVPNTAYGIFYSSSIAVGTIKELDASKALALPGVLDVLYYKNLPEVPGYNPTAYPKERGVSGWWGLKVLSDDKIRFHGQPIALIVAESIEIAKEAAELLKVTYNPGTPETDFNTLRKDPAKLKKISDYKRGKAEAYKEAPVIVEAEYYIPIEVHSPIELHATTAVWEGDDKLTVYDKTQGPKGTQSSLARLFGIPEKNVRVIASNIGGAFGNALRSWMNTPAACIAAKKLGRPVKIVLTRPQNFSLTGYRPAAWQQVGIGADKNGMLVGISHRAISNTSKYEQFTEGIVDMSRMMYACPNVDTLYHTLPLDLSTPTWMRGPGEATGSFALESALDELAYKLNMDPIQFRIKNFADKNPENGLPWSANNIQECYAYGAEKIGWKNRKLKPGANKEKDWLIGYGMGCGVFGAWKGEASIRAVLNGDGSLLLECAVSDMGPGTVTSMTKLAASLLQMPDTRIKFRIGDSNYPAGPTQGGSGTTSTVGSAVDLICAALKDELKTLAIAHHAPFAALKPADLELKNEAVVSLANASEQISVPALLKAAGKDNIELLKTSSGTNPREIKHSMHSFSVHFAKVAVHRKTGEIKVRHLVTTGDAGKVINEKTAKSQLLGGAIGGLGMALKEGLQIDPQTGKLLNATLGKYHVPKHTDCPLIDTWFVNKPDYIVNNLGSKGAGEIALIGMAAAIANAVFNASGKRVRELPMGGAE